MGAGPIEVGSPRSWAGSPRPSRSRTSVVLAGGPVAAAGLTSRRPSCSGPVVGRFVLAFAHAEPGFALAAHRGVGARQSGGDS